MEADPPARHSLLGRFQRVCYLVLGGARTHRSNLGELANCRPLCAASHAATDRLVTRVGVGVGSELDLSALTVQGWASCTAGVGAG
jgi:hypothetical protein